MIWIGIDVHKSFSRMATFDPATGELQDLGTVPSAWEGLQEEVRRIEGEKTVVIEAGRNSHFLAAKLEAVAQQVWIIDPAELRKLVKRGTKTDARDAQGLAQWAARDALKPLWRPSAQTLELRELTRGKQLLTGLGVQVRSQMRALLARNGFEVDKHKDLLSAEVQQRLDAVAPKLSQYAQAVLAQLRAVLPLLVGASQSLEPAIVREAKAHPQARRLQTLPGAGPYTALVVAVELDAAERFADGAKVRSYSGLCPSVSQSAQRTTYGPLTKRGNRYLRCALGLMAQAASRRKDLEPRLRRLHQRVAFKHGMNPAKMELARELVTLAHHLMLHEEVYQPREVAG